MVHNSIAQLGDHPEIRLRENLYEKNPAYPFYLGAALVILAVVLVFLFINEPIESENHPQDQTNIWKNLVSILREQEKSPLLILGAN